MMRRPLLLLALCAFGASAAAGQSRIRTDVDTTSITVGDRIQLTLSVEHAADSRVVWPDSLVLSPFEVVEAVVAPTRAGPDGSVSTAVLSITAFELGEVEIPSFEVAVVPASGEPEVLATDRFGIEVVSVGADETGDIREIRGPLTIPIGVISLLLPLLFLLLIAGLAYLAYRRFRPSGDAEEQVARGVPPRPAHELALEALSVLEASPLLERGQVKDFHIEVSEILRTYVERRYRVDALEMTTTEVLTGLERAGVEAGFREGLGRFLRQCDLVKFAKVRPEADASIAVLHLGRELVESSIPEVVIPDVDVEVESDEPEADESGTWSEEVGSEPALGSAAPRPTTGTAPQPATEAAPRPATGAAPHPTTAAPPQPTPEAPPQPTPSDAAEGS